MLRAMLWIGAFCGAYGQVLLGGNIFSRAGISSFTLPPPAGQTGAELVAEQLSAIIALCGIWVILTGRLRDPKVRPHRSQHDLIWPPSVRIALLLIMFNILAGVISRWLLRSTHLLPMGAGPFNSDIGSWSLWAREALAGPYEELGYTGLTGLLLVIPALGTTVTRRRMATGIILAATLRTIPHLYYADGQLTSPTILPLPDYTAAVLNQWVWCLIWAGGTLWIFVRYRRIWPLAVSHSAWDLMAVVVPVFVVVFLALWVARRFRPRQPFLRLVDAAAADSRRHVSRYVESAADTLSTRVRRTDLPER